MLGSIEPLRVAIIKPSSGVKPMVVSTHLPPCTADADHYLPPRARMLRVGSAWWQMRGHHHGLYAARWLDDGDAQRLDRSEHRAARARASRPEPFASRVSTQSRIGSFGRVR